MRDRLSQMLLQRTAVLDRLATNNTRLTHVFTEHSQSLTQSVADPAPGGRVAQERPG